MAKLEGLAGPRQPSWQGLTDNILRKGTPDRVYHIELYHDGEIRDAIAEKFDLLSSVRKDDPNYQRKKMIAVNRFCGFDVVLGFLNGVALPLHRLVAKDTAALEHSSGREYQDEHSGPIMSWEDFEKFSWPDLSAPSVVEDLQWYEENMPDDMGVVVFTGHFAEHLSQLMGYETLCYALFEQRDLVEAIARKLLEFHGAETRRMLEFSCVKFVWGTDDMGFKTGTLISPDDLREFVLPGHKKLAQMAHDAGRVYLLHSCGQLSEIIDDLTDDVKIDAKHSFEDTIEDVRDAKKTYGRKIALLGGIDMNFLCTADVAAIRARVRRTLDACMDGGGYCLGTGNSVANYVPLDNYLAMVDEGMLYGS